MQGMLQQATARFTEATGGDAVHGHAAALKELWSLTWREAQVQTFADAFLVIGVCLAIATMLVPMMQKVAPAPAAATNAH
jgi:DHA2 family multidrug resistance protein